MMMDWDRITQTGARTPGMRAVPGPILRCLVTDDFPRLRTGTKGRSADTKGGDKLEDHLRMLGASLSEWASKQVPSDMHIFQPYWGKPAVRNDRGDGGDVGIIRSPVRATILLDCGGGSGNWPSYRDARFPVLTEPLGRRIIVTKPKPRTDSNERSGKVRR